MGKLALALSSVSQTFRSFQEWLFIFADLSRFQSKELHTMILLI